MAFRKEWRPMPKSIDIQTWQKLDPKVRTLWRVSNAIATLVLAGLAAGLDVLFRHEVPGWKIFPFALPVIVIVFVGGIGQFLVDKSFDCYRFELGEEDLAVAKGIFWKSWRFVNRNRVQHVDVTSGPVARALGLVHVSIFVGGMHTAAAYIPGVSQHEAEVLRSSLVRASDAGAAPQPEAGATDA